MELSPEITVLLIAVLLLLSSIFSGSETAIFCLDRLRLKTLSDLGNPTAKRLIKLIENADQTLSFILVCNNIVNIYAAALVTLLIIQLYGEQHVTIGIAVLTVLILVFAEITPKTLATIKPELIAWPIAWIYPGLMKVATPILVAIRWVTSVLLWPWRHKRHGDRWISSDELRTFLLSSRIKLPKRRTRDLLNILDFETLPVENLMIPRREIQGIDLAKNWSGVLEQIKMYTYSNPAVL